MAGPLRVGAREDRPAVLSRIRRVGTSITSRFGPLWPSILLSKSLALSAPRS